MQVSTLLSLVVFFNAAQSTAVPRGKSGSLRHRPDYEYNGGRPVGGPRPTGTTQVVGDPIRNPPQTVVTVRPTVTVNPITTVTNGPVTTASPTTTPSATNTQAADAAYISVALQQHNIHRSNHSAADATWNTDLASYAKTVADGCVFAHDRTQGDGNYGQNLAIEGSSDPNLAAADNKIYLARAITNQWYNNEFSNFLPSYYGQADPDTSNFEVWGHFSQVVWKASTQIGCATSFCPAGTAETLATWYTVCDYVAAGNSGGGYGNNIGQPLGGAVVTAA